MKLIYLDLLKNIQILLMLFMLNKNKLYFKIKRNMKLSL